MVGALILIVGIFQSLKIYNKRRRQNEIDKIVMQKYQIDNLLKKRCYKYEPFNRGELC